MGLSLSSLSWVVQFHRTKQKILSNNSIRRQKYLTSESNDSFASLSHNGKGKWLSINEKSGSNNEETFHDPKTIVVNGQWTIPTLTMALITRQRIIVRSQHQRDQFPAVFLESQKHNLIFMSPNYIANKDISSEKKSLICLLLMHKSSILHSSVSSINQMSLCEICSKHIE